jgi:cell division protein FtsA
VSDRPALALDIGTRKVVGLLTIPGPKGLKIVAAEKMEHATRAMYDGQIHDVVEVAGVVNKIVERLAARVGFRPAEAAVAAAGRALRTFKGTAVRELTGLTELTAGEVFALELEAVQAAQAALAAALQERELPQGYHYVGHSVMQARLDGLPIGNLVGQRGKVAELDVIATFLPRGVVDSLQAVLARTGLEMTALTLEPIAALAVAVPPSMRHLNLVLVDIGAGTSDIAITHKGSVIAYDMVPIAGDEITEALSEAFLLDFNAGEKVKREIGSKQEITFTDILGQKQTVPSAQIMESLRPAVERLVSQIAERVLRLNGGPPQAVMLVGGGSLTPGLPSALASALGLPPNRVAVRGRDAIAGVDGARTLLSGPDAITPIGIAVAARDKSTLGFHLVYVNGAPVRLFHPSRLTVADALLAAGVSIRELQGRIGKGLTITLNGSLHIVRGTFGKPARILLNGEPAQLETPIAHRDQIEVIPGTPGEPGRATVAEVAPEAGESIEVTVNGEVHRVSPLVTVNGEAASPDRELADNDVVVVRAVRTVGDLLLQLGYDEIDRVDTIRFTLDGEVRAIRRPRYRIWFNGAAGSPELPLRRGDRVEVEASPPLTVQEAVAMRQGLGGGSPTPGAIRVLVDGQVVELPVEGARWLKNGLPASPTDPVVENDVITVASTGEPPIVAHLLAKLGAAAPPPGKTRLIMRLNGEPADFTSPLGDGDQVELVWE